MHDLVMSARRLADATPRLDLAALAKALFLEFFSWPLLRYMPYVRLADRHLLPSLASEWQQWLDQYGGASRCEIDPRVDVSISLHNWAMAYQVPSELLREVRQGLDQRCLLRRREVRRANRVSHAMLACAVVAHGMAICGVAATAAGWLLAGWFCAVIFATLISVSNRQWMPASDATRFR